MRITLFFLLLFQTPAFAAENCASDLAAAQKMLGDKHKATTWVETTANDRKPLYIQLATKNNKLDLLFFKTREGVWAQGSATICPKEKKPKLLAKISKQDITVGTAAPTLIRWGFNDGAEFTLTPNENGELKITTFGWGGTFVPSAEKNLAEAQAAVKKP